jgi:tetratricopeptide (TPR) repeat protein
VDTYTRHQLKQDKFVNAAATGVSWMEENRTRVVVLALVALFVVAAAIAGYNIYASRSESAAVAFGAALKTYQSPIRPANAPNDPTTESYATAQERAQTANKEFLAVADKYGLTADGRNARYYAGVTYAELGNNAAAESTLKQVASSYSHDVAALAKLALTSLYHSTNRDSDAIALCNDLIAHPTTTVPANTARLQLAAIYESTGNLGEARKIWAQIKDADKTGAAGEIATEKLTGKAQN